MAKAKYAMRGLIFMFQYFRNLLLMSASFCMVLTIIIFLY